MILGNRKRTRRKTRFIKATIVGLSIGLLFPYILKICRDHLRFNARHAKTSSVLQHYKNKVFKLSGGKLGASDIKLGFRKKHPKFKYLVDMKTVIGTCNYVISDLKYEIDIYTRLWNYFSEEQKIFLIAHELKHCECEHFRHLNVKFFDDGCPFSYMNSSIPSNKCFKKRFNHYLSELRKGCN